MLSSVRVQNFAIIEDITIEFAPGFTVLTGETGAGKSLIIDAIGLLFGDRSSTSMIRTGETKAMVEGIFENLSDYTKTMLDNLNIESLDDMLVVKREINENGKSLIRVNGEVITLSQLERLAEGLGDIHTQLDTKRLFEPRNYLTFIENDKIKNLLTTYQVLRTDYLQKLKEHQKLQEMAKADTSNLEFWQFQYQELEKANLRVNEINELEQELSYLNNYENIFKNLVDINKAFDEHNITEELYIVINSLEKLLKYDSNYQPTYDYLNNCYYEIEDIANRLKNDLNHLEYDENRLNVINERISYLHSLRNKYHKNIEELMDYRQELLDKINDFDQVDYKLLESKKKLTIAHLALKEKTLELTNARKESAKELEQNIKGTLKDLMLEKVQIRISFNDYDIDDCENSRVFKTDGCDDIDMLISFNVGEPLKSLSKVASGGEMSRVMLALKVHLLTNLHLSTMIFDEIDSGVSGQVADGVARKLSEISKQTQVLAITHLPIVASTADQHVLISKAFSDKATITSIRQLSFDERVAEIAKMISPNDQSNKSKELALIMLQNKK